MPEAIVNFLEPWKEAVVVVLRKPGKDDYTLPKSYRPIGLLSVLGKVLKRMMVRRIRWYVLPKANTKTLNFINSKPIHDNIYLFFINIFKCIVKSHQRIL